MAARKNTTTTTTAVASDVKPAVKVRGWKSLHTVKVRALVTTQGQAAALMSIFAPDADMLAFLDASINWEALTDDTPAPPAPPAASVVPITKAGRKAARQAVRDDYRDAQARYMLEAEEGTNGVLLTAKGVRAGVDAASLLTASAERFEKWASEEFADYVEAHPFPTFEKWCEFANASDLFRSVA